MQLLQDLGLPTPFHLSPERLDRIIKNENSLCDNDDDDYDVYDNQIIRMCQTFINIDSLHLPQILSRT